jgi:energy-coupling factor transporter ATP-binding protein EcfA2
MHIRRVRIDGIRSISKLAWDLPPHQNAAGWHVIIGDNGSGKSTFLRSIALALIGPTEPGALRQDWAGWLPAGKNTSGRIELNVSHEAYWDWWSGKGMTSEDPLDLSATIKPGDHGCSWVLKKFNIETKYLGVWETRMVFRRLWTI